MITTSFHQSCKELPPGPCFNSLLFRFQQVVASIPRRAAAPPEKDAGGISAAKPTGRQQHGSPKRSPTELEVGNGDGDGAGVRCTRSWIKLWAGGYGDACFRATRSLQLQNRQQKQKEGHVEATNCAEIWDRQPMRRGCAARQRSHQETPWEEGSVNRTLDLGKKKTRENAEPLSLGFPSSLGFCVY